VNASRFKLPTVFGDCLKFVVALFVLIGIACAFGLQCITIVGIIVVNVVFDQLVSIRRPPFAIEALEATLCLEATSVA
jgi:hypothetical protein